MTSPDRIAALRDRLEAIADELAELAVDALRDQVRSKAGGPAADERITQARRAVEKAAHLLAEPDDATLD